MTELEKKVLLTAQEYTILLEQFGQGKPIARQINYYFDANDLSMNEQNVTCRIRLRDGKYQGTMKRHRSETDGSTEIEIEVRNGIYDNAFLDMGLRLKGELVTERCVIRKDACCEVVLDKNEYLGSTDYELEIEYRSGQEKRADEVMRSIADVLRSCNPASTRKTMAPRYPAESKSGRFFRRWKKLFFNADSSCHRCTLY